MSGIWIIFLSLIGIAALTIVGYSIFYRISINKSLHSDKPKKRSTPKDIMIAVLAVLLVVSIGFSIFKIAEDFSSPDEKNFFHYTYEDTRGAAFDALFDDEDAARQSGYSLYVWEENGFEVRELSTWSYRTGLNLMPSKIIRVRYIGDLPMIAEGETLDCSFKFLYRDATKADNKFIGMGMAGEYKQKYIIYELRGEYEIQITAELRVVADKENLPLPFAEIQFKMGVKVT